MVNANVGYAGGVDGIYKSVDGAKTWTLLPYFISAYQSPDSIYFTSMNDHHIHFIDENVGYSVGWGALGNFEQIIKTTDGGATWQLQHKVNPDQSIFQSAELRLKDIHSFSANSLISVGYWGRILKTTDGGANWVVKNASTTKHLHALSFFNSAKGVIGGDGIILLTTDGGDTWTQISSYYKFNDIQYLTELEIIGITENKVVKSQDGGQTWAELSQPVPAGLVQMSFLNDKIGFVSGNQFLLKTTDAGMTFEKYDLTNTFSTDIQAHSESKIFMTSQDGKVLYSDGSTIAYSPIAYFQFTDNPCINQIFNATNLSPVGYTYEWLVDDVNVSTSYHLSYAFPAAGYHTLQLKASNGIKTDIFSSIITVRDYPPLPPYNLAANKTVVCKGDAVEIFVQGDYAGETFDLYSGNTIIGNVNNYGKYFYLNSSADLYIKLQATDVCGTRSGVDSLKITVVPKPSDTIQPKADKSSICSGDSTFIEIPNSEVFVTYTLTEKFNFNSPYQVSAPGNGGILKLQLPSMTKPTTFELYGKTSSGCEKIYGLISIAIRNFTVDFNISPLFPITNSAVNITNISTADTYEWEFGNNALPASSGQVNPAPLYSIGGEKIVKLKGSVSEGCFKTAEKTIWVMNPSSNTTLSPGPSFNNLLDSSYRVTDYKFVNGNHYLCGYISKNPLDILTHTFFIAKFNATGSLAWLKKRLDVETDATGKGSSANSFAIDNQENLYVNGYFRGNQFSIGDSTYYSKRPGHPDEKRGILMKFDKNGKIKWSTLFECAELVTVPYPLAWYSSTFPLVSTLVNDSLFVEMSANGPEPVFIRSGHASPFKRWVNQYKSILIRMDTSGYYHESLRYSFVSENAVSYADNGTLYTVAAGTFETKMMPATHTLEIKNDHAQEVNNIAEIIGYLPRMHKISVHHAEPDGNIRYFAGAYRFLNSTIKQSLIVEGDTSLISTGSFLASHDRLQRLQWFHFLPYAEVIDTEVIGTDLFLVGNYRGAMGSTVAGNEYKGIKAPTMDASIFLAKYDSRGILQWINNLDGGSGNDIAYGLEKNPCTNDLVVLASRSSGLYLTTISLDQDLPAETCFQSGFISSFPDIVVGDLVKFTDVSTGAPQSWQWTFDGGDVNASTSQTPAAVKYMNVGDYKVSLTISKPGKTSTRTMDRYISVHQPLVAKFKALKKDVVAGDSLDFTDLSEGDPLVWNWFFDGAGLGTGMWVGDKDPKKIPFPVSGTFKVTLLIKRYNRSAYTEETGYITVHPKIAPDFTASQTYVFTGQQVNLTNVTQGDNLLYEWTFPGGNPVTSTDKDASVYYSVPGTYSVTLRAYNAAQSQEKTIDITVAQKLTADFTTTKTILNPGDAINFTDLSIGGPEQYEWTFQGGSPSSSVSSNPSTITYNTPGSYKVSLKVTNNTQTDTKIKEEYITVLGALTADFNATKTKIVAGESINFSDQSQGMPSSWQWSFEGALPATDNTKNPLQVKYSAPGIFDVSLTTGRDGATKLKTKTDFITVYSVLTTDFTADKTEIKTSETIHFQNLSSDGAETFEWTFQGADPATSTQENPDQIRYTVAGEYDVMLKVTGNIQTKEIVKPKMIKVNLVTDIEKNEVFEVYPNPGPGTFIVKGLQKMFSVVLVNSLGEHVIEIKDVTDNEVKLHANPGVYILKIVSGRDVYLKKVIIK